MGGNMSKMAGENMSGREFARIPTSSVRSVSICVRERPRTFGNLANHSLPVSERSRSFANKTAY